MRQAVPACNAHVPLRSPLRACSTLEGTRVAPTLPGRPIHCFPLLDRNVWGGAAAPLAVSAGHGAAVLAGLAAAALVGMRLAAAGAAARTMRRRLRSATGGSAGSGAHHESHRLLAQAAQQRPGSGTADTRAALQQGAAPWALTRLDRLEAALNSSCGALAGPVQQAGGFVHALAASQRLPTCDHPGKLPPAPAGNAGSR